MGGVVSKGARGGRAQDKELEPIVIGFTQDVYERWEQVTLANAQIGAEAGSSSNNDRRSNNMGAQDIGQTTGNSQAAHSSNLRPTSVGVPTISDGGGDMPILTETTSSSMSPNPPVVPRDFGQRDRRRLERLGYTITNEGTLASPTLLADGDVDLIDHEIDLLGEARSERTLDLESPIETQRVTSSPAEVSSNDPDVETPFIPEIQVTEDMSLQNVLNLTKDSISKIPVIDASFKAGITGNRIFRKSKIGEYFANKLEAKTAQATGTTQAEIDNFMERAEKIKETLITPTEENPCSSFYPKVSNCYAKNKDDVTKCKGIVQQFANCVRTKRHQKKED